MTQISALPVSSAAPNDWWRRLSTTINLVLGELIDVYRRPSASVTADYSVGATDYALIVDASANAVTITLPDVAQGRELLVKRIDSNSNTVTLSGQIDGATNTTVEGQWTALRLIGGKDRWYTA